MTDLRNDLCEAILKLKEVQRQAEQISGKPMTPPDFHEAAEKLNHMETEMSAVNTLFWQQEELIRVLHDRIESLEQRIESLESSTNDP